MNMNSCIIKVELAANMRHNTLISGEGALLKNSEVWPGESHLQDTHLHFTAAYNEVNVVFSVLN